MSEDNNKIERAADALEGAIRAVVSGGGANFEYLFAQGTFQGVHAVNGESLPDVISLSEFSNNKGREGWELVSTVPVREASLSRDGRAEYAFLLIFKRLVS